MYTGLKETVNRRKTRNVTLCGSAYGGLTEVRMKTFQNYYVCYSEEITKHPADEVCSDCDTIIARQLMTTHNINTVLGVRIPGPLITGHWQKHRSPPFTNKKTVVL